MLELLVSAGIGTTTAGTIYWLLSNGMDIASYAALLTGVGFSVRFLAKAAMSYGKKYFIN